jgi:hypothetical protein
MKKHTSPTPTPTHTHTHPHTHTHGHRRHLSEQNSRQQAVRMIVSSLHRLVYLFAIVVINMFSVHSWRFALPVIMGSALTTSHATAQCETADDKGHSFSPQEFRSFTVRKVTTLSHNAKSILVDLPSKDHRMVSRSPIFFRFEHVLDNIL